MTIYESVQLIELSMRQLVKLNVSGQQGVPNGQVARVQGLLTAVEGAQRLRGVPGLQSPADNFLANRIVKESVQEDFQYFDAPNGQNFQLLIDQRNKLVEAAAVLSEHFKEVYRHRATAEEAAFVVKLATPDGGPLRISAVASILNEVSQLISEALDIAKRAEEVDSIPDVSVASSETGSLLFWLLCANAGADFLLWVFRGGLDLRGQWLKQKIQTEEIRRLGIANDMLENLARIHAAQTKEYLAQLARRRKFNKPLEPEDERRLEHSIKKSAELMLKNVQFLEAPGSSANREGRHLNEAEYKRLELPEKELLALESGTSHSVPSPSLPT